MFENDRNMNEQLTDATESGPETDLFSFLGQLIPSGVLTKEGGDSVFTAEPSDVESIPELWRSILARLEETPAVQDIAQGPSGVRVTYAVAGEEKPQHLEIIMAHAPLSEVAE